MLMALGVYPLVTTHEGVVIKLTHQLGKYLLDS